MASQAGLDEEGEQATTLADIVLPVLDELLEQALADEQVPSDRDQRRELLAQAVSSLGRLDAEEQQQLLAETRADQTNDTAIRNTLLLGGTLVTIGGSVNVAGFSAYILAAQASAFIPWISGPGLVSFVSVLSNPITILALATGGGWWWLTRARDRVNVAIAARIAAMLTLNGLQHGRTGLGGALQCFALAPYLPRGEGLQDREIEAYHKEWQTLAPLAASPVSRPSDSVLRGMATLLDGAPEPGLSPDGSSTAGRERANLVAMGTVTAGDMIYSVAAVDPTVLAAADFAHVNDIDGGFSFAWLAEQILDGSDRAILGGISHLKGYVAEKAVATQLTAAGHTVSFPDAANEPGWDLLVDGQEFQVKFRVTLDGLREHFSRYDYPVIANTELADRIPEEWTDRVFFIDGLSNELVDHITRESLAAGTDLLDPAVIPAAGAIGAARGLLAYRRGQLTGKQVLEQVMLDGMVRVGLAGSGGLVGAGVGLMLFGPAGAWVLGAGAPAFSQMLTTRVTRLLRERVKSDAHRQWETTAHTELTALQHAVVSALRCKREQLDAKLAACPRHSVGDYLRWRLEDDRRYTLECQQRLSQLDEHTLQQPEQRLADTLRVMAVCGVHPAIYQPELHRISDTLAKRPGLSDLMDQPRLADATRQVGETAERLWRTATLRHKPAGNDKGNH